MTRKPLSSATGGVLLLLCAIVLAVNSAAAGDRPAASPTPATDAWNPAAGPHHYVVSTLAGGGGQARSLKPVDGSGTAASFRSPSGIALAPDGNLYVADEMDNTIRRISPDGMVSTLAGQGFEHPGHEDGDCSCCHLQMAPENRSGQQRERLCRGLG